MRINNNLMALNTHRQLGMGQAAGARSMEKLSSGFRINRAGDDAAGLSISEKMRGQIRGLTQASRNAQDGISLVQTAEGALQETHAILQRMRELAVQSANDTNENIDREALQAEVNQLATEITRIAQDTEFNNQSLLDGNFNDKTFHIGSNKDQSVKLTIEAMDADTLSVGGTKGEVSAVNTSGSNVPLTIADPADVKLSSGNYTVVDITNNAKIKGSYTVGLADASGNVVAVGTIADGSAATTATALEWRDVNNTSVALFKHAAAATLNNGSTITVAGEGIDISSNQGAANSAIDTINTAIQTVSQERSKLGAFQNRLEHTIKNLDTSAENLQAAESRIRDVDMAKEMMEFTKNNILQQAATAMLAQANQAPQGVLQLLR